MPYNNKIPLSGFKTNLGRTKQSAGKRLSHCATDLISLPLLLILAEPQYFDSGSGSLKRRKK